MSNAMQLHVHGPNTEPATVLGPDGAHERRAGKVGLQVTRLHERHDGEVIAQDEQVGVLITMALGG